MKTAPDAEATQRLKLDLLVDAHLQGLRDGDVEALMATTAHDVVYELVGRSPCSVRGQEAVRAHHIQELANSMYERDVPLRRLYGDGFVVDEMVWEGRITGRIGSLVGHGRRVSHRLLRVFEVSDDRITRQSIYLDFASLSEQLA